MDAKMLRFITVLLGLQVYTPALILTQTTTEMPQPSSTASTSTFSSTGNNPPSTASSTSALGQTNPTKSTFPATSIHHTETSSQRSTGKITTTDHTTTASELTSSRETTDHWTDKLVSVTSIQSSSKEPGERTASTGKEITTTDHTSTASEVTSSRETTDHWSDKLVSETTIQSSSEEPSSIGTASTGKGNENPPSASEKKDSLPMNPGLVAILCIFFIVVALVLVVGIAKVISYKRSSQFERLEDLPMAQQSMANEKAPFARYPPK